MLYKLVVNKQIRMLDTKEPLTIQTLTNFINKNFPQIQKFTFYYIDEDQDHINIDTNQDINVYLENSSKKPKIYVQEQVSEKNVFDSNSHVIEDVSELKKPEIKVEQKEEEEQQEVVQIQEKVENIEIEDKKSEKQEQKSQQEKSIIMHQAKCNDCQVEPIKGIRYKCSQCQNFDLCGKCIIKQDHDESHPFVKIRRPESVPLDLKVQLNNEEEKPQEQPEEQKKQEKPLPNNSILKFANKQEKKLIIASYLESVLGPEGFESYQQFARQTNMNTKQQVLQSYLHWVQRKQENPAPKNVFNWLKEKAQMTAKSVGEIFSVPNNGSQPNRPN